MMKKPIQYLLFLLLAPLLLPSTTFADAPQVVINEVLASNATTNPDEDGDYEDWVELYNPGDDPISLLGWGLSDDYDNPFRWIFPDVSIGPGEFLLVWASGKDRNDPDAPLHANFRIASAGEEVLLTRPDEVRMDELPPTWIPTDVSYGRKPDGGEQWYYFDEPTPGQPNTTAGGEGILDPPVFSREGGFYRDSFLLGVSHDDPDVLIIYTLTGPSPASTILTVHLTLLKMTILTIQMSLLAIHLPFNFLVKPTTEALPLPTDQVKRINWPG